MCIAPMVNPMMGGSGKEILNHPRKFGDVLGVNPKLI